MVGTECFLVMLFGGNEGFKMKALNKDFENFRPMPNIFGQKKYDNKISTRVTHTDFGMGRDTSPP